MSRTSKVNKAYKLSVTGKVQGVGFRPFVYKTAKALGINGSVSNSGSGAEIFVECSKPDLNIFIKKLHNNLPPNSEIVSIKKAAITKSNFNKFTIVKSSRTKLITADIPPDLCVCDDCVKDIYSPDNRRYLYPFTNCTNCGPRFSIINKLPYDRANTTMSGFIMCPECNLEYVNPLDRRFHAQPNACPVCGPRLTLLSSNFKPLLSNNGALTRSIELLKNGNILAVKSIGGYHLVCDASNNKAVKLLRARKARPHKPFAVMMPDLETIKQYCSMNVSEGELLSSPAAPIVLLRTLKNSGISQELLAPGNAFLGVMIAYTPLHKLLFYAPGQKTKNFKALVMTSGNRSDEPISIDEAQIKSKLNRIADYYLVNNRPVHNRCDDSVMYNLAPGKNIFVRKSRGGVPEPIKFMPFGTSPADIFAAGAELKNTFCFLRKGSAYVSQHIGDLDNLEATRFYDESHKRLSKFFSVKPRIIAHDLHPDYYSTVYASKLISKGHKLKSVGVQHHHAHIASVLAEKGINRPVIGIAFDGNGLGTDGNVWGGECLLVKGSNFKRLAHIDYFKLPGGDIAVKEIWRLAVSLLLKYERTESLSGVASTKDIFQINKMLQNNINSPLTSSMGRLFDAVAALIGLRSEVSFEAQAAIEMESLAIDNPVRKGYNFDIVLENTVSPAVINIKPIVEGVLADISRGLNKGVISSKFHFTASEIIYELAVKFGKAYHIKDIVLSGGVFQNRILTNLSIKRLKRSGFRPHINTLVPPNDGGVSLGQAWIANKTLLKDK